MYRAQLGMMFLPVWGEEIARGDITSFLRPTRGDVSTRARRRNRPRATDRAGEEQRWTSSFSSLSSFSSPSSSFSLLG
ncbi:hypothetical protein GW17_00039353 [Ensete ventricosum]|uniref:Uncharacterized protein n=1 Tax=Ensete ventricosum TaxID=4639 RepID=A0A426XIT8_ENSVE|nr:hypothetical protein B296_00030217 [Ensete ventricosum]RWV97835.1 hypothetical protein GW17_00039353 [Ensete ventricosum]RZR93926.1 hypothetical protein BHM03_00022514 [Ensete ventricosum]